MICLVVLFPFILRVLSWPSRFPLLRFLAENLPGLELKFSPLPLRMLKLFASFMLLNFEDARPGSDSSWTLLAMDL